MGGLEVCKKYTKHAEVTALTDHKALQFLENAAKPKPMRFALRIAEFHTTIEHIGEEDNYVPGRLSRAVLPSSPGEYKMPTIEKSFEPRKGRTRSPSGSKIHPRHGLRRGHRKVYVPRIYRQSLLLMVHGAKYSGHVGGKKMRAMLQRSFWWFPLSKNCEEWARSCPSCTALRSRLESNRVKICER